MSLLKYSTIVNNWHQNVTAHAPNTWVKQMSHQGNFVPWRQTLTVIHRDVRKFMERMPFLPTPCMTRQKPAVYPQKLDRFWNFFSCVDNFLFLLFPNAGLGNKWAFNLSQVILSLGYLYFVITYLPERRKVTYLHHQWHVDDGALTNSGWTVPATLSESYLS